MKAGSSEGSGSLGDFARLDAGCTNLHAARATLRHLYADGLQIGIETSLGAIVRVRDVVAKLRALAADFATFCHSLFNLLFRKSSFITKGFRSRQADDPERIAKEQS